jgi:VanZ family protein
MAYTLIAALWPASGMPSVVEHQDKLVHALVFSALAWLGMRTGQVGPAALLAGLLLFGAGIEAAQWFTATRQAEWGDWLADGLGAGALLLWPLWLRRAGPQR